jgi:autotransporter-associated beta strand protein
MYGSGGGGAGFPGGAASSGAGAGGSFVAGGASTSGSAGTANTGGGGGGGIGNTGGAYTVGAAGGSGIVIVRYLGTAAGSGGAITTGTGTLNGYTLHTYATVGSSSLTLNSVAAALSGRISGTGGLSVNAAGGTLTLSGNNTYTGNTSITSGKVITTHANALGDKSAVTLSNVSGALLQLNSSLSIGSIAGGGSTGGSLSLSTGTVLTSGLNNASTTYAGDISGAGGMSKQGTGTLTLTGASTYTGSTEAGDGWLIYQRDALPTISGFTGAGKVALESSSASFASAVTSNYSFASTLTGVRLGKAGNSQSITTTSAISIAGPVEIYGGTLLINNNVQTSALGAKVLFKSTGNITLDTSKSITTNGGDITLWADSDASGAGGISIKTGATLDARRTVDRTASLTSDATGGGSITLAGGLDDGGVASGASTLINGLVASDGRPDGYAVDYGGTSIQYGVMLGTEGALAPQNANIKLYSGGGDIRVNGRVTTVVGGGGNGPTGLAAFQGVNMDAGVEGDLRLLGNAAVTTQYPVGIDLQGWRGANGVGGAYRTKNGDIQIVGRSSGATSSGVGLSALAQDTDKRLVFAATGTGTVTLNGKATGTSPTDFAVSSVDILAASGTIRLVGENTGVNFGSWPSAATNYLGSRTGGLVTTSTSDVYLTGNKFDFSSPAAVKTTGHMYAEPFGISFTNAQTFSSNLTVDTSATGLTFGKSGNTQGLTLTGAYSIGGPIDIYGGALAINGALTATSSYVDLYATGAVTQTAAITASGLGLHGTGAFTLNNTGNTVGILAAGDAITKVGNLSFTNSGALTVGTVTSPTFSATGITSTGTVLVETLSGDLALNQNISTTNATDSAVLLNAGKSAAVGTTTGGNILITGPPSITAGTGGTIRWWAAAQADSVTTRMRPREVTTTQSL